MKHIKTDNDRDNEMAYPALENKRERSKPNEQLFPKQMVIQLSQIIAPLAQQMNGWLVGCFGFNDPLK